MKFLVILALQPALLAADNAPIDPIEALKSIGVGAILALVPMWLLLRALKRIDTLEARQDELYGEKEILLQSAIAREREIANEITPVVREAGEALRAVLQAMDTVVDRVVATERRSEMDVGLRRIEHIYSAMAETLERLAPGHPDVTPT